MDDKRQRQQIRQFIGAWNRARASTPVAVLQAAVLERFASDPWFINTFLPIAIGCDPAQVRALLRDPLAAVVMEELRAMPTRRDSVFTLEHDCLVRKPR